jgi:hypothetical protein
MSRNAHLASHWPVFWQLKTLHCLSFLVLSLAIAYILADAAVSGATLDAVPNIMLPYQILIGVSTMASALWLHQATQHARVAAMGYTARSPAISLVFLSLLSFWIAPVLYSVRVGRAVATLTDGASAGQSYMVMQRAASLLGDSSDSQYEVLVPDPVKPLYGKDDFTNQYVNDVIDASLDSFALYSQAALKPHFARLFSSDLRQCSSELHSKSTDSAVKDVKASFDKQIAAAADEVQKSTLLGQQITAMNETRAQYTAFYDTFEKCVKTAAQSIALFSTENLKAALRYALRNAYLIYYSHLMFTEHSADYYKSQVSKAFVAPEMSLMAAGDIANLAAIIWLLFYCSLLYKSSEYIDTDVRTGALQQCGLLAFTLLLFLPLVGVRSRIPLAYGDFHIVEACAAYVHWPLLILGCLAVIGLLPPILYFRSSTTKSRALIYLSYLLLPLIISAEFLNLANGLKDREFLTGDTPGCGLEDFATVGAIHCAALVELSPSVQYLGDALASLVGWETFWTNTASRLTVSIAAGIVVSWPVTFVSLMLLKREFVRPRDK